MWSGETEITAETLKTRVYSDVILHDGRLQLPFGPVPAAIFLPLALLPDDVFPTLTITLSLLTTAVGLVPALTFCASGFTQIGYRCAADICPLLFLALITAFGKKVPRAAKALIVISVIAHITWMIALFT